MEREHYDWYPKLLAAVEAGNREPGIMLEVIWREIKNESDLARKILEEGKNPGEYFDGHTHFFDVIQTIRELILDSGVKAIGIFGSRTRKEHVPLRSDVDLLVINDTPIKYDWSPSRGSEASRDTFRYVGVGEGINIQECSSQNWQQVVKDVSYVSNQTYEILKSVRWLWIRDDYTLDDIPLAKFI